MDERYETIAAWFAAQMDFGMLDGVRGPIRYCVQRGIETQQGWLIIVSGRTEFIEKYQEVVYDLRRCGFRFCLYDHYGQGGSARPLADREKGHIDNFSDYVDDLTSVVEHVSAKRGGGPVVLLCHSMGSAVAVLAGARYPDLISGMVLVSPMLQINTGLLPSWAAERLSLAVCLCGGADRYVMNGGPFRPDMPFAGNLLTSDARRFSRTVELMREKPELRLGDPTFGWLLQACRAMRTAQRAATHIRCPVMLLGAGADKIVRNGAMETFASRLPHGRLSWYPGARHELLLEQDHLRDRALEEIKQFLASLAGEPTGGQCCPKDVQQTGETDLTRSS